MIWTDRRERGNFRLLQLAFWIIRTAGWHAGQALLYPITLYFYVSSPGARAASRDYLSRVLDHPVRACDIMQHFFTFACVLLDRIFFLSDRTDAYAIEEYGVDALISVLAEGHGAVLLGAHLGSFDMLRAFGRKSPVAVNPVMFRSPGGVFSRLMESLDPEMARRVIDLAAPGAMLKVQECIGRGEIVGFLGDRTPGPQRVIDLDFLGGHAAFPIGPLVMASVLRAPVVLFYGVRIGARRYAVHFEPFADRITLRRASREHDVRHWMQLYADRLASACRLYPFNWFNFFPFWDMPQKARASAPKAIAVALAALAVLALSYGTSAATPQPQAADLTAAIMTRLAALPDRRARFTDEKHISSLAAPLQSKGVLIFRHPDLLEKRTEAPHSETMVIEGSVLTIMSPDGQRRIALDDHPALAGLATTLTSVLAGNQPALEKLFTIGATGSLAGWQLTLQPRDKGLARFVSSMILAGQNGDLHMLQIMQANGDSETMRVQALP